MILKGRDDYARCTDKETEAQEVKYLALGHTTRRSQNRTGPQNCVPLESPHPLQRGQFQSCLKAEQAAWGVSPLPLPVCSRMVAVGRESDGEISLQVSPPCAPRQGHGSCDFLHAGENQSVFPEVFAEIFTGHDLDLVPALRSSQGESDPQVSPGSPGDAGGIANIVQEKELGKRKCCGAKRVS